jgi:type I restriction enzyme S subunit
LAEVADVRFSSVDKLTRSSEVPVRLCNYIDVYKNQYITRDLEFMQASATRPEIERYGLQVGDVIITKDSETPNDIGIPAVVDYAAPDLLCGYHLAIVRARSESVDPTFLAKQLAHHRVASYFGRQANGLTRYGLPLAAVQKTPLWLPCRCEQSAIGTLLRLVDEAIAESDAVVAKLRFISSGLLRDLLTRGVDDNGELRDPLTDPAGFKDCSLGRFPVTWDVKPIEELLLPGPNAMRSGPFGSALLKQELKESGIPLLGIDNVQVEQFVSSFTRFVDEQKFQELRRYAVRPRDIMITIMGTVGRCCVVPNDISVALSSKHVWTISLDESRYSPFVACWQINFAPWVLRQFKRDEQGGVMTAIRSETLRNLLLPVPPMPEMRIIERLLLESKAQINHQVSVLSKLKMLRLGLASDLLSGYVRVPRSFVREEASV